MTNSPASSSARRGSILRLQLASLLSPPPTPRVVSGAESRGALLRSLDQDAKAEAKSRPESPNTSQEPNVRPAVARGRHKPDASAGQLEPQEVHNSTARTSSHPALSTTDSETLGPGPIHSAVSGLPRRLNPQVSTILSSFVLVAVGVVDYLTGPHISLSIVYLLPVIFAAWFAGKDNGMLVAVVASLVWVSADVASFSPPPNFGVALWNVSSRLAVFAFVVLLLARIRKLQAGLEETIARRTRQLELERARGVAMEREVAAVSTREQQRIAHELHDGLGQELGGLAFHAKVLAAKLAARGVPLSSEAERLVSLLNQSISRTRALSNLLDPVGCESGGLLHALEQLAERAGGVFAIACAFQGPAKLPPISADAELDLYRIAQEAIHNATQHGNASEVTVRVTLSPCALTLSINDNGCGFTPDLLKNGKDRGMGLRIMRYRASGLGASLEIDSAPDRGCIVRCTLPVNNADANLTPAHESRPFNS